VKKRGDALVPCGKVLPPVGGLDGWHKANPCGRLDTLDGWHGAEYISNAWAQHRRCGGCSSCQKQNWPPTDC